MLMVSSRPHEQARFRALQSAPKHYRQTELVHSYPIAENPQFGHRTMDTSQPSPAKTDPYLQYFELPSTTCDGQSVRRAFLQKGDTPPSLCQPMSIFLCAFHELRQGQLNTQARDSHAPPDLTAASTQTSSDQAQSGDSIDAQYFDGESAVGTIGLSKRINPLNRNRQKESDDLNGL
jgi:hypothetical protein